MQRPSIQKLITYSCVPILLLIAGCNSETIEREPQIRPIKAIQISTIEKLDGKHFPGIAKATQEADLSFRVAGTLTKMPVKIGQQVRAGDILAQLDKRDFQVDVDNARANFANANAQFKNAGIEYKRVRRIKASDKGAVSQSTIDNRLAQLNSSKATVDSAQARLNASLDRLSYSLLKAPFSGVIVKRYVENFQDITAKRAIFKLVDISKIEMDINIPENLIADLPDVKNVRVSFNAFAGVEIPAKIKEVSNEASQSTRTYRVRLIIEPPKGVKILPGMSGSATGELEDSSKSTRLITVPIQSLIASHDSTKSYVWKYDTSTQKVYKTRVVKGALTDQGVLIESGLKNGDWIATGGVHYLVEEQKVRLLQDSAQQQSGEQQ